jgi:hypothetical protein
MANEEQLAMLKQGAEIWNKWREENLDTKIDLTGADLREAVLGIGDDWDTVPKRANLIGANLRGAILNGANVHGVILSKGDLRRTDLIRADLSNADLRGANLTDANLTDADLSGADLVGADFSYANLRHALLSEANLSGTDLSGAHLGNAKLESTHLQGSNLGRVTASSTNFGDLDLRQVTGLDAIEHTSPSTIGTNTFAKSVGKIPEAFLRGCGLSDWEIEETKLYNPDLNNEEINKILYRIYDLRASQALQISPLFISYSHADSEFVDKVGDCLTQKGIRYWRDIHKATAGPLEEQVNRAIRQNPTVLVILSEHSTKSDWVEHEVRTARETGKELRRHVLCPVALDDSWKSSRWPKRVMEQIMEYNILDFSAWEDDSKFDDMFRKLIDGLELFYKG